MRTSFRMNRINSGLSLFLLSVSMVQLLSQTGCSTGDRNRTQNAAPAPTLRVGEPIATKVFVTLPNSFNGSVRVELKDAIPLGPEDKPDSAVPSHVNLTIDGEYTDLVRDSRFKPGFAVYEVEKFRDQLSAQPGVVVRFDEHLKALTSLLNDKPDLNKQGRIEIVRYIENTQVLRTHQSYISFKGGGAVVYVTQFNPDASYVNNRELTYVLQGLTSDGKYYLFGTFPVAASFLPKDSGVSEFEGYKIPAYSPTEAEAQEYSRYVERIKTRLESTPPEKFQPDLREICKLISSIEIRNE